MSAMTETPLYTRPAELLQYLIRFDTTNPPGNERECLQWLAEQLHAVGIESTLLASDPDRPNLIARIKGQGHVPPRLLQGHVDVVTTENQRWTYPPFGAEMHDGMIWGRGALDMKSGVAMMTAAFLQAHAEQTALPGDVILCLVSDEEAGGDVGARFLVEQHPEQFTGVKYALGEFGGFTIDIRGARFYPIMIAEKQICALRMVVRGPAGHGSLSTRGGAMARLGQALTRLDQNRLPVHITPPAKLMINGVARALPAPAGPVLGQLANPMLTNQLLGLLGSNAATFDPLVRHSASPTMLRASSKINVIPAEVELGIDGRILPGYKPDDLLRELRTLLGPDLNPHIDLHVERYDPGPESLDVSQFETLAGILREMDPAGHPIPLLLSGVTDARYFSRLGIQTYGFLPMPLPADFAFASTIHAANERIPVAALEFGTRAIFTALQRLGTAG